MLQHYSHKLDRFYELTTEEQKHCLDSILKIANSNPEEFTKHVQQISLNPENHLPHIYEALSDDLEKWSTFFLNEYERLVEIAKRSDNPNEALNHLKEFLFINPDEFKHREELLVLLKRDLKNQHSTFRYYAVTLLSHFITSKDFHLINLLKESLKDDDWKVRYWTYMELKDLVALETHEEISLLDKVRVRFFDTLKFK